MARMSDKIIVGDGGHGGTDSGAVGNGLLEKNLTLQLSLETQKYLEANYTGFKYYQTRTSDKTLSLKERADYANKLKADVFLSFHINSATSTSAEGFESFVYTSAGASSKAFQNVLHKEVFATMQKHGVTKDRGMKSANYHVLRETNMTAVLTETLFINNKKDANFLMKDAFIKDVAKAHALGLVKFLGLAEKPKIVVNDWYLQRYPDVAKAGMEADTHYNQYGKNEGRFRTVEDEVKAIQKHNVWKEERYLAENQDVAQAVKTGQFKSGLHHFVQCGQFEGR